METVGSLHPTMKCKCDKPFVLRVSKHAKSQGQMFWGCHIGNKKMGGCGEYHWVKTAPVPSPVRSTSPLIQSKMSSPVTKPASPMYFHSSGPSMIGNDFVISAPPPPTHSNIAPTSLVQEKQDNMEDIQESTQESQDEVKCNCGLKAAYKECKSSTSNYFGQWFYTCSKPRGQQCGYWETETRRKEKLEKMKQTPASAFIPMGKLVSVSKPSTGFDFKYPYKSSIEEYRKSLHNYDNKNQVTINPDLDERFVKCAKEKGFQVRVCGEFERIHQHTDFELFKGERKNTQFFIKLVPAEWCEDVQGKCYESIFLCVKDSIEKNAGFISGGKGNEMGSRADVIAFENPQGFYMLKRKKLWEYIETHVSQEKVEKKEQAWNKIFQYKDTNRQETRVKIDDLRKFKGVGDNQPDVIMSLWVFKADGAI